MEPSCCGCGVHLFDRSKARVRGNIPFCALVVTRSRPLDGGAISEVVLCDGSRVALTEYAQVCSRACLAVVAKTWSRAAAFATPHAVGEADHRAIQMGHDPTKLHVVDGELLGAMWGRRMPQHGKMFRPRKKGRRYRPVRVRLADGTLVTFVDWTDAHVDWAADGTPSSISSRAPEARHTFR